HVPRRTHRRRAPRDGCHGRIHPSRTRRRGRGGPDRRPRPGARARTVGRGAALMVIELAIVGAGPCGLAAGIAARRAGITCVLFDKGCVASSISGYPTWMTFFSTADRLEIGGVPFVVTGHKPTRREALRYYQRLAREFDLDVHQYESVVSIAR